MAVAVTPFDVGFDVASGAVVVATLAAVVITWRRITRRWRSFKQGPVVRGATAFYEAARTPGGLRSGTTPARLRMELWNSVSATTRAVRKAIEAGAPIGELPELTRRLHQAAQDLDRLLSIAGGLRSDATPVADLRRQVGEALRASEVIRTAALSSAGDVASVALSQLSADAEREVQSVAAGVARSRAALSGN